MFVAILILVIINIILTLILMVNFGGSIEKIKYVLGIKGTSIEKDLHKGVEKESEKNRL